MYKKIFKCLSDLNRKGKKMKFKRNATAYISKDIKIPSTLDEEGVNGFLEKGTRVKIIKGIPNEEVDGYVYQVDLENGEMTKTFHDLIAEESLCTEKEWISLKKDDEYKKSISTLDEVIAEKENLINLKEKIENNFLLKQLNQEDLKCILLKIKDFLMLDLTVEIKEVEKYINEELEKLLPF